VQPAVSCVNSIHITSFPVRHRFAHIVYGGLHYNTVAFLPLHVRPADFAAGLQNCRRRRAHCLHRR